MKNKTIKDQIHEIIFESNSKAGKAFDVVLLVFILLSVVFAMIDSVNSLHARYDKILQTAEWVITGIFTIE